MAKQIALAPYIYTARLIGWLLWPFSLIPIIKERIVPLVKLVNTLFINSPVSTFIAIWYPMILWSILANVGTTQFLIYGVISLIPIIVGVQVMPGIIIELKNSSLLKRIKATNVKNQDLMLSLIFYFTLVSIVSVGFNIGLAHAIYGSDLYAQYINWGSLIVAFLCGVIVAMTFGVFLSGILKSAQTALVVGLLLTLPGAFLSGQFLPVDMIDGWGPVKYIAFAFPQKSAAVLTLAATNDGALFSFQDAANKIPDGVYISLMEESAWLNNLDKYNLTEDSTIGALRQVANNAAANGEVPLRFWIPHTLPDTTTIKEFRVIIEKWAISDIPVADKYELLGAWLSVPTLSILFSILSIKTFKWGIR